MNCDLPTRETRNKSVSGQSGVGGRALQAPGWIGRDGQRGSVCISFRKGEFGIGVCVCARALRSLFVSLRDSRTVHTRSTGTSTTRIRTKDRDHRPATVEPITTVLRRYRFSQVKTIGNSGLNSPLAYRNQFFLCCFHFIDRFK